jgi:hypothetical protein
LVKASTRPSVPVRDPCPRIGRKASGCCNTPTVLTSQTSSARERWTKS